MTRGETEEGVCVSPSTEHIAIIPLRAAHLRPKSFSSRVRREPGSGEKGCRRNSNVLIPEACFNGSEYGFLPERYFGFNRRSGDEDKGFSTCHRHQIKKDVKFQ